MIGQETREIMEIMEIVVRVSVREVDVTMAGSFSPRAWSEMEVVLTVTSLYPLLRTQTSYARLARSICQSSAHLVKNI
jgi:hypothetical protein